MRRGARRSSRYAGLEGQKAAVRAVTDEIMYAILELSGQEYVDRYAAEAKAGRTRARPGKFPRPRR